MGETKESVPVVLIEQKYLLAQVGQVAVLEDDHIVRVMGVEKIKEAPYGKAVLETIPIPDVNEVQYRSIFGAAGFLGGLLSLLVGTGLITAMVAGGFISPWMIGAAPVLALAGLALIIGCRRRRLIFSCKDREISWTSGALEFKDSAYTIVAVLKWAEQRQVTAINFPDVMELLRKRLGM
ncbi:MAG: hypothetical protein O7H41_17100 [Planctomycetota bacterium]|nr:hypothetical protein [Planctomycetota bacterium]